MSSSWDFRSDGTLLVTSESVLAGLDQEVYRWEQEGPFHVRLGFPPDDETPDGTWASVRYEFVVLEHDVGKEVVLRAVGTAGFWLSDAPLARDGRSALDRSAPPRF
ncbi:MAG: hypothetical protein HOW73_16000 [Polyangiaceae bacterium]|nr:hypothetical protein [Polyangiaceae bacterium]